MIEKDEAWPHYTNDFFKLKTFTTDTKLEW